MSKKTKAKNREERRKKKRAAKQANQERWQKLAEQGRNTKSKRARRNLKKKTARMKDHPEGRCGNPACIKCRGIKFQRWLRKGLPENMPQWMWLKWRLEGR